MSSIISAKAISLATTPGAVEERPHARVFRVNGTGGEVHHVIVGARPLGTGRPDVCTCRAGQRGAKCSHAAAAHLAIARERRDVDNSPEARRARGLEPIRPARSRRKA